MLKKLVLVSALIAIPALLTGQGAGVSPAELLKPLKDSWPTYNGDYSGKRYSALKQIDRSNVKHLTLAWASRLTAGPGEGGGRFRRGGNAPTLIVGGEGTVDF